MSRMYGDSVISHVPDSEMPDAEEILVGLRRKAKKYGELEEPYIIALCSSKMFVSEGMFADALIADRDTLTGLWAKGRNARVSAVLACDGFNPSALSGAEVRLFHNPHARYPLPTNPFGSQELRLVDGVFTRTDFVSLSELLGLPADWLNAA